MTYIIMLGTFQALLALILLKISREHRPFHQLISCLLSLTVLHLSIKFLIFTLPDIAPLRYKFNTFLDLAYGPLIWMIANKIRDDRYVPYKHWYLFLPTLAAAICYTGILTAIFITGKIPTAAIDWYNTVTIYCMIGSFLLFPVLAYRISQRFTGFWKTERKFIHALSALTFFGGLLCVTGQCLGYFYPGHSGFVPVLRMIGYSCSTVECLVIVRYLYELQAGLRSVGSPEQFAGAPEQKGIIPMAFDTPESVLPGLPSLQAKTTLAANSRVGVSAHDDRNGILAHDPESASVHDRESASAQDREGILAQEQHRTILEQIDALMQVKKIYMDADLSLDKLSAQSRIPRHHISEALNRTAKISFYHYINEYRVKEVVSILDKCRSQHIAPHILSLAYEAGFNSKSTFNHYFKKITGFTSSDYLKQGGNPPALPRPAASLNNLVTLINN